MYVLRKNPIILASAEAAADTLRRARQRLADATEGLVFEPGEHRYLFAGRELRSVSSIVEHFAPFDTIATAKKCAANPKSQYFGQSIEEILNLWELKRDNAADAGTRLHAFGEACCSFLHDREDEIAPEYRERINDEGLVAVEPKEEALARWWAETDWDRFAVVAKETRVMNPGLRYAGTFDLLLYDRWNMGFAIKDYKSNEDLYKWYGDKLLPPLDQIKSNDVGKYTVQQTLYAIALKNIEIGRLVATDLIWLKEDGYESVEFEFSERDPHELKYEKLIAFAVKQLINQTE